MTTVMRDTAWLAQRLGISIHTIVRKRAQGSPDLPPHMTIGRLVRYDPAVVEQWCCQRQLRAPVQGVAA